MKKLIYLLICLIFTGISTANASEWLYVGKGLGGDSYIDKQSIKNEGNILRYWSKEFRDIRGLDLSDEYKSKCSLTSYFISENEFDYLALKQRKLTRVFFNDGGKSIEATSTSNENWKDLFMYNGKVFSGKEEDATRYMMSDEKAATALATYLIGQSSAWQKVKETTDIELYRSPEIDSERRLVWVCQKNIKTGTNRFFLLQHRDGRFVEIYNVSYSEVATPHYIIFKNNNIQ